MSYLTITELTNAGVNLPANGFTIDYIEQVLDAWTEQINLYTGTQFTVTNKTKDYNINQCRDTLLNVTSWQETGLTVQLLNKQKEVIKTLILNTDYNLVYSFDDSCIIALDFSCLSCLCKCDFIRLSGSYGWSNTVPTSIKLMLINLVRSLISTGQSNSNLTIAKYVTSEKSRNLSRSIEITDSAKQALKVADGLPITSLLQVTQLLSKYRTIQIWQELQI